MLNRACENGSLFDALRQIWILYVLAMSSNEHRTAIVFEVAPMRSELYPFITYILYRDNQWKSIEANRERKCVQTLALQVFRLCVFVCLSCALHYSSLFKCMYGVRHTDVVRASDQFAHSVQCSCRAERSFIVGDSYIDINCRIDRTDKVVLSFIALALRSYLTHHMTTSVHNIFRVYGHLGNRTNPMDNIRWHSIASIRFDR